MIGTALLLDNAMQEIQELDSFETMPALVTPLGLEILSSLDSGDEADNEFKLDDERDNDAPIGNRLFDPNLNSFSWSDASSGTSSRKVFVNSIHLPSRKFDIF